MFVFIVVLRALACALITNSHMEEIYPIRILASGGLYGDVLYFMITAFLLYPLRQGNFVKWYTKRLKRIYLPVWLMAGTFILGKVYGNIGWQRVLQLMIYPTHYHFVASILVMYIIYYFAVRLLLKNPEKQQKIMGIYAAVLAIIYFAAFYTVFDRSYYHIDNVNSRMIWPLYLFSMLAGVYFKIHSQELCGKPAGKVWLAFAVAAGLYFASKVAVSRGYIPYAFQWVNQAVLLMLGVCTFRCFMSLEEKFKNMPSVFMKPIQFISEMAFEMYLAQAVIIPTFNTHVFPRNFIIVMSITVTTSWLLHNATEIILWVFGKLGKKEVGVK